MSDGSKALTYGLSFNPRPHMVARYTVLCAVLTAVSSLVSWLAVISIPGGFLGVGALYFASIFYAVTTYWFAGWGLVASFFGAFVGSGLLSGMPVVFAIPFAVADIWEPLIPFLFLRVVGPRLGLDPLGRNILVSTRNTILFSLVCAALPPFVSGLWGTWILATAGFVPPDAFWIALLSWWLGAAVLLAVFVPPICRGLSNFIEDRGLACHGIWS